MTQPGMSAVSSRRLAYRLFAAIAVAVIVLLGIWVTGGLITNDFTLSMVLTTVWLGASGIACALIAWRSRELRVPVAAAYLLTAAAAGIYLGRSILFDDVVDEQVVTAAPVAPAAGGGAPQPNANVLLARGRFEPIAHDATGVASTIRRAEGGEVLTLTDFEVSNGPDLRVYLVAGPARSEEEVDDFKDLGALKGNKGNQQYELPAGLDLSRYPTVVIWCRAFSVEFARAPLTRG